MKIGFSGTLQAKLLAIASELLDRAADEFGNHGCNDWKWPADITSMERRMVAVQLVTHNTRRTEAQFTVDDWEEVEHHTSDYGIGDWQMMRFLVDWLLTLPMEITRLRAELKWRDDKIGIPDEVWDEYQAMKTKEFK